MAATSSASQRKKYDTYKTTHQREKNKIKHINRHLKEHPNDEHSFEQIARLEAIIANK